MALPPWEYKVESFFNTEHDRMQDNLNRWGSEGWELIAVSTTVKRIAAVGNEMVCVMKRPGLGEFKPDQASGWG